MSAHTHGHEDGAHGHEEALIQGDGPHGTGLQYYLSADPASLDPALSNDVQSAA